MENGGYFLTSYHHRYEWHLLLLAVFSIHGQELGKLQVRELIRMSLNGRLIFYILSSSNDELTKDGALFGCFCWHES